MCKYYKFDGYGDAIRIKPSVLRQMGGKTKRVNRHDIGN